MLRFPQTYLELLSLSAGVPWAKWWQWLSSANYHTDVGNVSRWGRRDNIFPLEPQCLFPGSRGDKVTCDVSHLLLSSCQTRAWRKCDSLDTFYGEMIQWLSIIYFIFDINQKEIIWFNIWDMGPLYSKYFIFPVKYFPFIFSISGSRIVIIVSFIFTNFTKYKRFIQRK